MLATISGAGPMTGFLGTVVGMIQAFHKMATAGGQIEVEPYPKEFIPYDNYRCWTCCGYYCLCWIQSPSCKNR
jgi:hypothetical protein